MRRQTPPQRASRCVWKVGFPRLKSANLRGCKGRFRKTGWFWIAFAGCGLAEDDKAFYPKLIQHEVSKLGRGNHHAAQIQRLTLMRKEPKLLPTYKSARTSISSVRLPVGRPVQLSHRTETHWQCNLSRSRPGASFRRLFARASARPKPRVCCLEIPAGCLTLRFTTSLGKNAGGIWLAGLLGEARHNTFRKTFIPSESTLFPLKGLYSLARTLFPEVTNQPLPPYTASVSSHRDEQWNTHQASASWLDCWPIRGAPPCCGR